VTARAAGPGDQRRDMGDAARALAPRRRCHRPGRLAARQGARDPPGGGPVATGTEKPAPAHPPPPPAARGSGERRVLLHCAQVCRMYRNPNEPRELQLAAECPFIDSDTAWILRCAESTLQFPATTLQFPATTLQFPATTLQFPATGLFPAAAACRCCLQLLRSRSQHARAAFGPLPFVWHLSR